MAAPATNPNSSTSPSSRKRACRSQPGWPDPLTSFLTTDRRAVPALALAAAIGAAYALILFGPDFLLGRAPFWLKPAGNLGGPLDMSTVLAAYHWFLLDAWRWPLLHIPNANWPEGFNAFALDVAPLPAILGKLLFTLTGWQTNPYPVWHVAAFTGAATALAALLRSLGQRSLLAAIAAGALGAMAPMLHMRFGHQAQLAHFLPIFALALYFHPPSRTRAASLLALCVLAGITNLYLFVITAAIAAAAFLRDAARQPGRPASWLLPLLVLPLTGLLPAWALGLFHVGGLGSASTPFGHFSMNLLAPFWPQNSGLFLWTGLYVFTRGGIGATAGQYEGFSYLGFGVVILLALAIATHLRALPGLLARHWPLTLTLAALFVWSVADTVYLGTYPLLRLPVPDFLQTTILAWFRSNGRFFWPVAWMLAALAIAGALARLPPRAAVAAISLALALQWQDLAPWRTRLGELVNAPAPSILGPAADRITAAIAARGAVTVIPSFFCASGLGDYNAPQNITAAEAQLAAARANARMRWILLARGRPDCALQRRFDLRQLAAEGVVILTADPAGWDRLEEGRGLLDCEPIPTGLACALTPR